MLHQFLTILDTGLTVAKWWYSTVLSEMTVFTRAAGRAAAAVCRQI